MNAYVTQSLAHDRIATLQREADEDRLASSARRQPGTIARIVAGARAAWRSAGSRVRPAAGTAD